MLKKGNVSVLYSLISERTLRYQCLRNQELTVYAALGINI